MHHVLFMVPQNAKGPIVGKYDAYVQINLAPALKDVIGGYYLTHKQSQVDNPTSKNMLKGTSALAQSNKQVAMPFTQKARQ